MAVAWQKHPILLGSQSPRRAQLLKDMGLSFRQLASKVEEHYPSELKGAQIAEFLAELKANSLLDKLEGDEILICSDTVVWLEGKSLEKAKSKNEAREMLLALSGKEHAVISGLFMGNQKKSLLCHDQTLVKFKSLSIETIDYYIDQYQPFDKAGAYGIQEWIGMVGIESIKGSYFTVMGLPCHRIAEELEAW